MARIVIITPGHLGSNPRVVKEANTLHAAGHNVKVISAKLVDFVECRDQDIMACVPWSVERLDFTDRTFWVRERILQEIAKCIWPVFCGTAAMACSAMSRRLAHAAISVQADLYIAHYPPALPAAARAAMRWDAKFAFDAEDFHLGDLPDSNDHQAAKAVIREIERRYLSKAAYVTAASPGIAEAYTNAYDIPLPHVLLNTFPVPMTPAVPTRVGSAAGPSVYWFSQTIGPNRGLETAIEAIAQAATRPHLYLRGTSQECYAEQLTFQARKLLCDDRLHFLPPGLPSEMETLAAVYDAGLVGETGGTYNRRVALTNKQFTYFLAGLPALMSDIPAHQNFSENAEGAVFLYRAEDPKDLARRMDDLFRDPALLAEARARAFTLGRERFNWEAEAPKLISLVQEAII